MTGNAGTRESHSTVAKMLFRVLTFTEHSLDLSFNLKIDMRPAQAVLYSDLNLESVCFSSSCFACTMSCYITYHAAARMLDGYHPAESIAMMLFYCGFGNGLICTILEVVSYLLNLSICVGILVKNIKLLKIEKDTLLQPLRIQ